MSLLVQINSKTNFYAAKITVFAGIYKATDLIIKPFEKSPFGIAFQN